MEWSDWCYWDVSVVTSLVQFVLHELHPDDIVFKVIHGEYTIKDNTCFQLKPMCYSFSILLLCTLVLRQAMSITLTLWLTFWKAHVRSLWILMLMHRWIASTLRYATVQALVLQILCNKCSYTLICHLNPHRWFHMLDSKALLADSWWWYIQWPWPIRMQYKHWQWRRRGIIHYTHWNHVFGYSTWSQATVWAKWDNWYQWSWMPLSIQNQYESKK